MLVAVSEFADSSVRVCEQENQSSEIAAYPSAGCSTVAVSWTKKVLTHHLAFTFYLQIATLLESRRGDSNPWPAHYECAVRRFWTLHRLANPALTTGFLFPALPTIAGYCVRVRVKWDQQSVDDVPLVP